MAHAWVCPEHGPYFKAWCRGCDATHKRAGTDALWNPIIVSTMETPNALVLSHPADPEAGAMGLARLAWVATVLYGRGHGGHWKAHTHDRGDGTLAWSVELHDDHGWRTFAYAVTDSATCAAEAIALVCVNLGLLERVERVAVTS